MVSIILLAMNCVNNEHDICCGRERGLNWYFLPSPFWGGEWEAGVIT